MHSLTVFNAFSVFITIEYIISTKSIIDAQMIRPIIFIQESIRQGEVKVGGGKCCKAKIPLLLCDEGIFLFGNQQIWWKIDFFFKTEIYSITQSKNLTNQAEAGNRSYIIDAAVQENEQNLKIEILILQCGYFLFYLPLDEVLLDLGLLQQCLEDNTILKVMIVATIL